MQQIFTATHARIQLVEIVELRALTPMKGSRIVIIFLGIEFKTPHEDNLAKANMRTNSRREC